MPSGELVHKNIKSKISFFVKLIMEIEMNNKLSVIIEEDDNGFFCYCPELKGCHSQGDSYDEAFNNIKEAIDLYLETIKEHEIKPIFSKNIFSATYEVEFA